MTYADDHGLEPPPERGRTAWETEHLDDPHDDAGRFDQLRAFDMPPTDWRTLAEEYRRERDYWRGQADYLTAQLEALQEDFATLQRRYGVR